MAYARVVQLADTQDLGPRGRVNNTKDLRRRGAEWGVRVARELGHSGYGRLVTGRHSACGLRPAKNRLAPLPACRLRG